MIIDAQQLAQDTEIHGSIAIVGAGAAGIVFAIELSKHFRDVVVLESGGWNLSKRLKTFIKAAFNLSTLPSTGSTSADTSRHLVFAFLGARRTTGPGYAHRSTPVDFKRIADRTYSGWPIQLDDLIPFYARAFPIVKLVTMKSLQRSLSEALNQ